MTESDDRDTKAAGATATGRPPGAARDPASGPPAETSKPLGDALPAPSEPGLDRPLPPKAPADDHDDHDSAPPSGH